MGVGLSLHTAPAPPPPRPWAAGSQVQVAEWTEGLWPHQLRAERVPQNLRMCPHFGIEPFLVASR